jgi:hypothetical protein
LRKLGDKKSTAFKPEIFGIKGHCFPCGPPSYTSKLNDGKYVNYFKSQYSRRLFSVAN